MVCLFLILNCLSQSPDLFISGLSSHYNEQELAFGNLFLRNGVHWAVLGDTHFSCTRSQAYGRVDGATAIVASPLEIQAAKDFGYKDAVYLGGPPFWQSFRTSFAKVSFTKLRDPKQREIFVGVGGIKDPPYNQYFTGECCQQLKPT